MRSFPRTARQRLATAATVGAMAAGALTVPTAHADDLKDRRKHVQGQIHSASKHLGESSGRLRRATASLDSAERQLRAARNELLAARAKRDAAKLRDQQMQEKLAAAVERLHHAREALSTGQQAVEDQQDEVTDTITDIYEEGDPQLLAFSSLLDAQDPADLTRRMEARNVIVGRETRAYDGLHAAAVLLQVREDEVRGAKDEVAVQRRAAAEHLVTMRDLVQKTHDASAKVRDLVQSRRKARQQAAAARHRDQVALTRLRAKERKIKQQILAAARRARGGYHGSIGGLLLPPVTGPVTSPFGYREHPIYHYWGLHDGTDFGVSCGEGMRAAGTGTVTARYWSSVYGNRLYLNVGQINGKNVTVVYNHATGYRVGVGDHVTRGEVVGYVGSTGWSTGCHLHFTVLVNGTAVNPMSYL